MSKRNDPTDTDASTPDAETSSIHHRWMLSEPASTAVVEAVSAATDREPIDLAPLHDYVDADALDALVRAEAEKDGKGVFVSFVYDGVEVAVDSNGAIEVQSVAVEGG